MWVKDYSSNIVNLDRFRTIHLESGALLARNGRAFQVLYKGDGDGGSARFHKLLDGLNLGLDFLDLS